MEAQDYNDLPTYLEVNVTRLRKCPRCGGKHYEKSVLTCRNIEIDNGRVLKEYKPLLDAGSHWDCKSCGLSIIQDGSWEIRKI